MKPKIDIREIYTAALTVFAAFGYKKATVDDIAGRLGMTKGALYVYVKNKRDLYEQTVRYALLDWQRQVGEAIVREPDARQRFFVMCRKAIDYLDEAHEFRQILKRDPDIFPMFADNDPFEDINADSVAMIRAILNQGIAEKAFRTVDVDRSAQVIFSIYKMFIIRTYIKDSADKRRVRALFEESLDLMTRGLFKPDGEGGNHDRA